MQDEDRTSQLVEALLRAGQLLPSVAAPTPAHPIPATKLNYELNKE